MDRVLNPAVQTADRRTTARPKTRRPITALLALLAVLGVMSAAKPSQALARQPTVDTAATATAGATSVDGVDAAISDSVVRLYRAVFDREPDVEGLRYWVTLYVNGTALDSIAGAFMESAEWENRYGSVGGDGFVDLLYRNVLGREGETEGRQYWRQVLADGSDRPALLLFFSESSEFVTRTETASPRAPFPPAPANSGSGRRIVYSNTAQRVWLLEEDGTIRDSYLVSGRRDTPTAGTYSVYSKSTKAWAGHDGITMNHMVRFARGRRLAIGFHSIPTYRSGLPMQTLQQLGTHQSAGCVRQEAGKAEALYHWADVGTTVVVLD